MKAFLKANWKTLLFFGAAGLVGGFFTGLYLLDSYPPEIQQTMLEQGIGPMQLSILTAVQSSGYGMVLGAVGILLGKLAGLWKGERCFERKPLLAAAAVSLICGLGIILPDLLYFGRFIPAVAQSYEAKPTLVYLLGAVIYGGIIEEVMLRLFWMSLIAVVLKLIFQRHREAPGILIAANVITALLFAAGHLPATLMLLGSSPMILLRCFLLNGGAGLMFGWLYRKYGLRYSMIAHAGAHLVSKLIWILFI